MLYTDAYCRVDCRDRHACKYGSARWRVDRIFRALTMAVSDTVIDYAVSLVTKTRPLVSSEKMVNDFITWGAGPPSFAVSDTRGQDAVPFGRPDIHDVKRVALPVLRHRLITNFNAEADGVKPDTIITKLIAD